MSLPTKGETYAALIQHLRMAQEASAMLSHLNRDDHAGVANNWLKVSENLDRTVHLCTQLATRGLQ